ncbi:MAG TPA: class B sortase [Bacillota bacterium]|nr:class B sortase [Bacillota bacterium]
MREGKRSKLKRYASKVITIVCIGIIIYAAYGLIDICKDYYQNQQVTNDVRETFHEAASAEKKERDKGDKHAPNRSVRPEFIELLDQNPDVVGWIAIDDTNIDYPIVQSQNNTDYLTQDFNKNESSAGSIFMDFRNHIESLGRNTIIYGHRMKDGSMFKHLTKFLDRDFFTNHRTFDFDTLYDSYNAEIFAVYNTTTDFNYIQTDFDSDEDFEQLLADIRNESLYETDVDVDTDDQIITLSTCDYELDEDEGRLVVQAKLTKKEKG